MKWEKRGLVYVPSGEQTWAKTHAYLPTAQVIHEERIRVYFSSLDRNKFGSISYIDLDADDPRTILQIADQPILEPGLPGTFDDSGVNPSCVLTVKDQTFLYYIGWQRAERVPYMLFCGLAIGENGHFQKYSTVPILDRTKGEPYLRSATTVIADGSGFKMWYVSALGWVKIDGKEYPEYVIRNARSPDGIHWQSCGEASIQFESDDEFGFGRPWVVKEREIYRMWYSIRSRTTPYRIGYAESKDGETWVRKDSEVGIAASLSGWDSEMICFPCVVDVKGRRFMFYNGNRHGETGFGLAELIDD